MSNEGLRGSWKGRTFARVRHRLPSLLRDPPELLLAKNSVLRTTGWLRSRHELASVNAEGEPIPWITYPALRFLEPRVGRHFQVFEFGSGLSTLWWAKRVAEIISVEHDRGWHDLVSQRTPKNASLLFAQKDDYVGSAQGSYDVVIIDGIMRPECARASISSLKPSGVFVWDNTDEQADREGHLFLEGNGFRRLDFWGFGPLLATEFCTSIFYRTGNCLEI